ncbi:NAD(P)/FAD-dependent oxidoreductase [Nitratifractor sp.]
MGTEYDVAILGAGASGLMLAARLERRYSTILLDSNPSPGAKIAVSGGGRCNLCNLNLSTDRYRADPDFIRPVFDRYDQQWLLEWVGRRGVAWHPEAHGKIFCDRGARSLNRLFAQTIPPGVFVAGERVVKVEGTGPFRITGQKRGYSARTLVVASGGRSFPKLGASGIGYEIAESYGHRIETTAPALVGLSLQPDEFFMKELAGISTEVELKVGERRWRDRLLFAHRGLSGPAILNASLWWQAGEITIDFIPGVSTEKLCGTRQLTTLLPLPKRAARAFLERLGVPDRPVDRLSDLHRRRLQRLKAYRFAPAGTFGYGKAEVTRGGVSTREIDPYTMESRRQAGLYFIGEVLDVTGELGGYNFQWAFSSAAVAADALNGTLG